MCANATPLEPASPFAIPTGRNLLSRLTGFRSRARNLTDYHIHLDEPHRQYSSGDLVKGAVVLTVVKPIRITHLTVTLHGFVRVYKRANGDGEPPSTGLIQGNTRKSQYFGNGHASLFQDEVTLCGEGRLDVGVYEFNFELEFPKKGLPSSIDFERGTISYMVSSTMTRPTSIAATSSCDRKVSLVETIDIGPMHPPKPRTISLEPISRRPKKRSSKVKTQLMADDTTERGSCSDRTRTTGSPVPEESASQADAAEHHSGPQSPRHSDVHSEISGSTNMSNSTGPSFRLGQVPGSASSSSTPSATNKTITATIELLKAGCLPGENIPLKISIQHTKVIKSLHGIIITLYRQGRIDSAPPLSLFMDVKGKAAEKLKHEEYYPKSKTGLGGLSLSSAGSSSVFRKDLSQTFAPLIIDPTTLCTEVKTSIRVPADAFPTIAGVPGHMIGFKYHIEVVVDLGGKLAGQDRFLPRLGMINLSSNQSSGNAQLTGREDDISSMLAALGGSIVDTDHIRRERSVVACLFDLTVGTTDSARQRGRGTNLAHQRQDSHQDGVSQYSPTISHPSNPNEHHQYHNQNYTEHSQGQEYHDGYHFSEYPSHQDSQEYQQYAENEQYTDNDQSWSYYPGQQDYYAPVHVPLPEVPAEENLDEKARIRKAEERLLPSQPPEEEAGPSSRTILAPSAPLAIDDDIYSIHDNPINSQIPLPPTLSTTKYATPSAPTMEDIHAASHLTEDKQELERYRLLAEASAPSDFPDEDDDAGEGPSAPQLMPSAPILTEEDEYGGGYSHTPGPAEGSARGAAGGESLPAYRR